MNEVAITLKAPSGCFLGMIKFSAVDLLLFQLCIMYTCLGLSNIHESMDHNQVPIIYYWYDQLQFSCFHDIMKMLDFLKYHSCTLDVVQLVLKILIFFMGTLEL